MAGAMSGAMAAGSTAGAMVGAGCGWPPLGGVGPAGSPGLDWLGGSTGFFFLLLFLNKSSEALGFLECFFSALESPLEAFQAREREVSMKVTATTQVNLDSTVDAPRPPKTLEPVPPPKAAPMPPPFPACNSTVMIRMKQTRI